MARGKGQVGLFGSTYWAEYCHLLNWVTQAWGTSVQRTALADISGQAAIDAGYLTANAEFSASAPTNAISYSFLLLTPTSGVTPVSIAGETFKMIWDGVASDVQAFGATISNKNLVAGTADLTLTTPVNNTTLKFFIDSSNRSNPPRNIRVIQSRYMADTTLDGITYKGYTNGGKFNPHWLHQMRKFGRVRYMDLMGTNWSALADYADLATENYARVPAYKNADIGYKHGYPLSLMCELAWLTGCDVWLNIPHLATTDFITQVATYMRDHMPPTSKVIYAWSNEVWNSTFSTGQWGWNYNAAIAATWTTGDDTSKLMQHIGYKAAGTMAAVYAAYGAGKRSRWTGALEAWSASGAHDGNLKIGIERYRTESGTSLTVTDLFDEVCVTGYFNVDLSDTTGILSTASTSTSRFNSGLEAGKYDYFCRTLAGVMRTGTAAGGFATGEHLDHLEATWQEHLTYMAANGMGSLDLTWYEGGNHCIPTQTQWDNATFQEFFVASGHHAEIAAVYLDSYQRFEALGGTYPAKFVEAGPNSKAGLWGGIRYFPNVNDTDGDFDNPVWQDVLTFNASDGLRPVRASY